jgi:hypothetical protein
VREVNGGPFVGVQEMRAVGRESHSVRGAADGWGRLLVG